MAFRCAFLETVLTRSVHPRIVCGTPLVLHYPFSKFWSFCRAADVSLFLTVNSTFKDPSTIASSDPDARLMAPLLVGDYVDLSGTLTGSGLLEVYSPNANIQFFTAPGKTPAYLWCEEAIYGIVTNQEAKMGRLER